MQFSALFSIDFIERSMHQEVDSAGSLKEKIIEKCEELLPRDIRDNKSMGQHGALHILQGASYHTS